MKRDTLFKLCRTLMHYLTRTTYIGLENIPPEGAVIIATNHLSQLDTVCLMVNPRRSDITALVADKYQKFAFMKWFITTANGIWIDRDRADFAAFHKAAEALKQGWILGIAPEGTRSTNGGLLQGKPGTILLALKASVPVIPVGIHGTEAGFKKIFALMRPKFYICYGKPFSLPPLSRDNREESMQQMTDEIMCRIAALLPEAYRGYYKDNPRVAELLARPQEYQVANPSEVQL